MFVIQSLIFSLFISSIFSYPVCNLSIWKDSACSESPDTVYPSLTFNGNCTMFPNDPSWTTYKLSIDIPTKTVQHFLAYNFKNCYNGNDLFFAKTPLSLDTCAPLFLVIGPGSNVTMGSSMFNCKI